MSHRSRWAIAMTVLGLVAALAVFAATGSAGWALVGLLSSSLVANALVQTRAVNAVGPIRVRGGALTRR